MIKKLTRPLVLNQPVLISTT